MNDGGTRKQYDHGYHVETQLGGGDKPKRRVALRVLPKKWKPREGVPETRGDCPTFRPCPFVRCEWNLWMTDGRDRPGRRGPDHAPPASTVEVHSLYNCGADLAEESWLGRVDTHVIAEAINRTDRQVRRIVEKALVKLREIVANDPAAAEVLRELLVPAVSNCGERGAGRGG